MAKKSVATVALVDSLRRPGRHHIGGGLYLKVLETGGKSWAFIATWARSGQPSKRNQMGLGSYPAVGLADARRRAEEAREHIAHGRDPLVEMVMGRKELDRAAKVASGEILTFGEFAKTVVVSHGPHDERARLAMERHLTKYTGAMANKALSEVTREDVIAALRPYWLPTEIDGQIVPARLPTARRFLVHMELVFNVATAKRLLDDTKANPADRKIVTLAMGKADLHPTPRASLPWEDAPEFIEKLRARELTMVIAAVQFCILTCVRKNEAYGARWQEIDLEKKLWTIPAERMKGKHGKRKKHIVPLSDEAIAILALVEPVNGRVPGALVFPSLRRAGPIHAHVSSRQLHVASHKALFENVGCGGITLHGFRATFSTWAQDSDRDKDLSEMCLAHAVGSAVFRTYARSTVVELRRKLMDDWGKFLFSLQPLPVEVGDEIGGLDAGATDDLNRG